MNIGFDLDGVLYNWHLAVYNELVIHWNLKQNMHDFWSVGYKTYKNEMFWDNLVRLEHLYGNQAPLREDLSFLKKLGKKHNIYYVTNRPKESYFATINWLNRYEFPQTDNLIFCNDKGAVVDSIGINVFVEDRVENIRVLESKCHLFVVRQPYNLSYVSEHEKECNFIVINRVYEMEGMV